VQSATYLRDQPIAFILVGQGPEKAPLQERVSTLGLSNVIFLPTVAKSAVPSLLAQTDAGFIGLQKQPLFRFGVSPNKLMDYMMAAKPILYAIDAGNNPVAEARCGISIPPEDPEALASAAMTLMRLPSPERTAMGCRGRQYVSTHHDYQILARNFLSVIGESRER
jgi:glycosyltransferase involved in cell wall biosynthesis